MPMMTITIRSSINVKPARRLCMRFAPLRFLCCAFFVIKRGRIAGLLEGKLYTERRITRKLATALTLRNTVGLRGSVVPRQHARPVQHHCVLRTQHRNEYPKAKGGG